MMLPLINACPAASGRPQAHCSLCGLHRPASCGSRLLSVPPCRPGCGEGLPLNRGRAGPARLQAYSRAATAPAARPTRCVGRRMVYCSSSSRRAAASSCDRLARTGCASLRRIPRAVQANGLPCRCCRRLHLPPPQRLRLAPLQLLPPPCGRRREAAACPLQLHHDQWAAAGRRRHPPLRQQLAGVRRGPAWW
jgi:hypothetical protein